MSTAAKVFKGASWLAFFNLVSQIFSWLVTIIVARILVPSDYGLIEIGTILTGYAAMFNELGLGAAIIQKPKINQDEISSVFWFSIGISALFSAGCFPLSHLTAYIFEEPRVIPLTQAVSLVFLFSGLQIVPFNLLKKRLSFKYVGIVQMSGVVVSCCSMLVIAHSGGGAWTLMLGMIIRSFVCMILSYLIVKWTPSLHFNFQEAKPYVIFGITTAISRSLFYIYDKSDMFLAGKFWTPKTLGYYAFAMQLSKLPTEKITVIINQVSFAAFSQLQNDKVEFNKLYLNIVKITMTIVLPLFIGGFLVSEELVHILLGPKWLSIIFIFKFLCLIQVITSLNAVNSFVHVAKGRPLWSLIYHAACAVFMPISFYFAVQYGINYMLIPWFTTYLLLCLIWIFVTIHAIDISKIDYLRSLAKPFFGTMLMVLSVVLIERLLMKVYINAEPYLVFLISKMLIGGLSYLGYLWFFDRKIFSDIKKLRNTK